MRQRSHATPKAGSKNHQKYHYDESPSSNELRQRSLKSTGRSSGSGPLYYDENSSPSRSRQEPRRYSPLEQEKIVVQQQPQQPPYEGGGEAEIFYNSDYDGQQEKNQYVRWNPQQQLQQQQQQHQYQQFQQQQQHQQHKSHQLQQNIAPPHQESPLQSKLSKRKQPTKLLRTTILNNPPPWHHPASSSLLIDHNEYINSNERLHRTPLVVPDSKYQKFLLGELGKQRKPGPINPKCCASCCTMFSGVAFVFLLWVAILVDTQPIYIKGVMPKIIDASSADGKVTVLYELTNNERLPAASNAYYAAFAYLITFLICIYNSDYYDMIKSKLRQRYYQTIPDAQANNNANSSDPTNTVTTDDISTSSNADFSAVDDGWMMMAEQQHGDGGSQQLLLSQLPSSPNDVSAANNAYQLSAWNRIVAAASSGSLMLREYAMKRRGGMNDNHELSTYKYSHRRKRKDRHNKAT